MFRRRLTSMLVGAVALAAAVLLVAAISGGMPPVAQLRMVGNLDAWVSTAMNEVPYSSPVTMGSIMLCVSSPATATISRVAIHEPEGDIRVTAFAARPNPTYRNAALQGDEFRPLASVGHGFDPGASQQLSGVCPRDVTNDPENVQSKTSELAVEVSWTSGATAGGSALDVTYAIGDTVQIATVPFGIWLCAATCPPHLGQSGPRASSRGSMP